MSSGRKSAAPKLSAATDDGEDDRIVARPDGYHWIAPDGRQEFGPFESLELARADMDGAYEAEPEPGETLEEAERALGVSEWIDPQTGEPAQGPPTPHLSDE